MFIRKDEAKEVLAQLMKVGRVELSGDRQIDERWCSKEEDRDVCHDIITLDRERWGTDDSREGRGKRVDGEVYGEGGFDPRGIEVVDERSGHDSETWESVIWFEGRELLFKDADVSKLFSAETIARWDNERAKRSAAARMSGGD